MPGVFLIKQPLNLELLTQTENFSIEFPYQNLRHKRQGVLELLLGMDRFQFSEKRSFRFEKRKTIVC